MSFFHFDMNRCIGCKACVLACKQLHGGISFRKVRSINEERYLKMSGMRISSACESCPDPRCVAACKNEAFSVAENGRVVLDEKKCKGSGACAAACPYGAPVLIDGIAHKCDMCEGREGGPFCVAACPQGALTLSDERQIREVSL